MVPKVASPLESCIDPHNIASRKPSQYDSVRSADETAVILLLFIIQPNFLSRSEDMREMLPDSSRNAFMTDMFLRRSCRKLLELLSVSCSLR